MRLRNVIMLGVFVGITSSCAYDNAEDLYGVRDCPPEGVSFSDSISPLISTNCAVPGCHVSGSQPPALETYEQIAANGEKIRLRTSNGTMPPPSSGNNLTPEEIDAIGCWVDAGAPDN